MNILKKGDSFGKYKLIEFIGSGATAEVWSCTDPNNNLFAIKVFAAQLGLDDLSLKELENVYRNTTDIVHENILPPIDFGTVLNRAFFIFDKICENSLAGDFKQRWIDASGGEFNSSHSGLFSEDEIAEIILQVARGLDHLHVEERKVHLDMKPANVLYISNVSTNKRQYLIHDLDISVDLRKTIMRVGAGSDNSSNGFGMAPGYASPEQFTTNYHPASSSDIFSLGISLFELTSGFLPGGEGSFGRGMTSKTHIPRIQGNYSAGLREIVAACMQFHAEIRPTADDLIDAAEQYLSGNGWPKVKIKEPSKVSFVKIAAALAIVGISIFGLTNFVNTNDPGSDARELMQLGGKKNWVQALELLNESYSDNVSEALWTQIEGVKKIVSSYSEIGSLKNEGVIVKSTNGFVGLIDSVGNEIIPIRYEAIGDDFSNGYIVVAKGGYTGIVNQQGEEIISPTRYKGIGMIKHNIATIGGECIDLKTKKLINCRN